MSSSSSVTSLFKANWSTHLEIISAFTYVSYGHNDNSTQYFGNPLCAMCPIISETQDYNFGFYIYYKNLLVDGLAKTPYIVIMFDESFEGFQKS